MFKKVFFFIFALCFLFTACNKEVLSAKTIMENYLAYESKRTDGYHIKTDISFDSDSVFIDSYVKDNKSKNIINYSDTEEVFYEYEEDVSKFLISKDTGWKVNNVDNVFSFMTKSDVLSFVNSDFDEKFGKYIITQKFVDSKYMSILKDRGFSVDAENAFIIYVIDVDTYRLESVHFDNVSLKNKQLKLNIDNISFDSVYVRDSDIDNSDVIFVD